MKQLWSPGLYFLPTIPSISATSKVFSIRSSAALKRCSSFSSKQGSKSFFHQKTIKQLLAVWLLAQHNTQNSTDTTLLMFTKFPPFHQTNLFPTAYDKLWLYPDCLELSWLSVRTLRFAREAECSSICSAATLAPKMSKPYQRFGFSHFVLGINTLQNHPKIIQNVC